MAQKHVKPKTSKPARSAVDQSLVALRTILSFSACMVVLPSAVFYASHAGYFDILYKYSIGVPKPDKRIIIGGILAIFVVNLVVAGFVYVAFQEEAEPDAIAKPHAVKEGPNQPKQPDPAQPGPARPQSKKQQQAGPAATAPEASQPGPARPQSKKHQ